MPPGSVTESNCTMSPTAMPCAAFVIVHVGDPLVVAIVADVKVVFKGVISVSYTHLTLPTK